MNLTSDDLVLDMSASNKSVTQRRGRVKHVFHLLCKQKVEPKIAELMKRPDNLGFVVVNFQNSPIFCVQKTVSNIGNFLRRNTPPHLQIKLSVSNARTDTVELSRL